MEIFSALLAFCAGKSPITGEFPTERPVTRNFDVFFDLCLNLSRSVRRHCNVIHDTGKVVDQVTNEWAIT